MIALLDADIYTYRVGYTTMEEPVNIALWRLDNLIGNTLEFLKTDDYECYLSGADKSNFRYDLLESYKGTRKASKPTHYHPIRSHFIEAHGAYLSDGQEADDDLAIRQSTTQGTCIVSIDKDLDQVPGLHFNFVKGIVYEVTPIQGLQSFYRSLLTGDTSDNIHCIRGIGPAKASKLINHLTTEQDMYGCCQQEYAKAGIPPDFLTRNARLLWIRRQEGEVWQPPV